MIELSKALEWEEEVGAEEGYKRIDEASWIGQNVYETGKRWRR